MIDYDQNQNGHLNPNGCGIGLTVSKRYIEHLNGFIDFESSFGIGTCIKFKIPLIRSDYQRGGNIVGDLNRSLEESHESACIAGSEVLESSGINIVPLSRDVH